MRYARLAARNIDSSMSLPLVDATYLGGMQHLPNNQSANACADGMNTTFAPLPKKGSVDDESIRADERQRIARDIHDELGQQLLVLRIDVLRLCKRINDTHPDLDVLAGTVRRQLDTTTESLRAVIRGLHTTVLDLGLHAAIESQCTDFYQRFGIACERAWNAGDITLTDHCATALFRTLQESLTNVQRHARASRVRITVDSNNNHIVMTVSDNGIGSVPADHTKTDSFGLLGMRERISALGGTLAIASAVHEGMTVTVSLPI
jgi:signal transduction histidine kinase